MPYVQAHVRPIWINPITGQSIYTPLHAQPPIAPHLVTARSWVGAVGGYLGAGVGRVIGAEAGGIFGAGAGGAIGQQLGHRLFTSVFSGTTGVAPPAPYNPVRGVFGYPI
jgi:hypothetical protein